MPMPRFRVFHSALLALVVLLLPGFVHGQAVITTVNVYKQTAGSPPSFLVEIIGTSLQQPEPPRVLVYPSATVQPIDSTATEVRVMVKGTDLVYVPIEVTLSYSTGPVSKPTQKTTCSDDDIDKSFLYVTQAQAKKKYGGSVGVYFDVIQMSMVNKCSLPVLVPLAGIYLAVSGRPDIHALSLDHVTSIYSNGKEFTGGRAIYFNILQAAATLGSAIEPFFGHGFTQGVSILGGGFTQGSAAIWKDLSAEQLQNLASQSFQSTEQVAGSGGSLQKFIFLPKTDKKDLTVQNVFTNAAKARAAAIAALPVGAVPPPNVSVLHADIIPVIAQPPAGK
jgi:hypothetical protein